MAFACAAAFPSSILCPASFITSAPFETIPNSRADDVPVISPWFIRVPDVAIVYTPIIPPVVAVELLSFTFAKFVLLGVPKWSYTIPIPASEAFPLYLYSRVPFTFVSPEAKIPIPFSFVSIT